MWCQTYSYLPNLGAYLGFGRYQIRLLVTLADTKLGCWWQGKMCLSGSPMAELVSTVGESQTRDLSIASPTL